MLGARGSGFPICCPAFLTKEKRFEVFEMCDDRYRFIFASSQAAQLKAVPVVERMSNDRRRIVELEASLELAHKGYEELQDRANSLIKQRDKYAAALLQWRWYALMMTALLVGCFIGRIAGEAWGGK